MQFDYNYIFKDYHTPWAGHRYFARDLVKVTKPKNIVELGSGEDLLCFPFYRE